MKLFFCDNAINGIVLKHVGDNDEVLIVGVIYLPLLDENIRKGIH